MKLQNKSNLSSYSHTLLATEHIVYATAFLVPFVLSHPQLLVGTTVNALLFITAAKMDKKHILPMAVLPSIAALSHNVLFGPFTMFLLYFIPFIWAGNALLMYTFQRTANLPGILRVVLASAVKAALLFTVAFTFVQLQFVPKMFLLAMGQVQLLTALVGGVLALGIIKLLNK